MTEWCVRLRTVKRKARAVCTTMKFVFDKQNGGFYQLHWSHRNSLCGLFWNVFSEYCTCRILLVHLWYFLFIVECTFIVGYSLMTPTTSGHFWSRGISWRTFTRRFRSLYQIAILNCPLIVKGICWVWFAFQPDALNIALLLPGDAKAKEDGRRGAAFAPSSRIICERRGIPARLIF